MDDFVELPISLYKPITPSLNYWQLCSFILASISVIYLLFIFCRKKKQKQTPIQISIDDTLEPLRPTFAPADFRILTALTKQIEANGFCTADDLHLHLGVLYKSAEVHVLN